MIPLTLRVGSTQVVDDETFGQKRFIEMVEACPECPKTTCPSLKTFKAASKEAETEAVFVITLSGRLSGSCNSAAVAKRLYEEEMVERGIAEQVKKVVIIDPFSASSGELNVALFIQNLYDSGLEFDEVVEKTLIYRDSMDAYFMPGSLDTLRKNGHLSDLQASFATTLDIRPVMGANTETIIRLDRTRGMNRAPQRMCDIVVKRVADAASKIAVVYHMDNPERAEYVKDELAKRVGFKKIAVTNAVGAITAYANNGGIVLAT